MSNKIGFIGAGNMSRSLIGGLLSQGPEQGVSASHIFVHDPSADTLADLSATFGIQTCDSNQVLLGKCDTIVLAVKPQVMRSILEPLTFYDSQLVISIAAGLRCASLNKWIDNTSTALIRTMPNTPALVQQGATALYAMPEVSDAQKSTAEALLQAVGISIWVDDEDLLDSVTALSGSGPAYYFYMMEAMQSAAIELGINAQDAKTLTIQTALGAAVLAAQSADELTDLRHKVTSPGGTTEQAINSLTADNLRQTIGKAMQAAYDRSKSLADELDEPD